MKQLTLLLFFFSTHAFAQKSEIFHIDSLPTEGITLSKGWTFQTGDNPQWALPNFDDSTWLPIDPSKDINSLSELKPGVIGWFRLHFTLDSLLERQLGMMMQCSGATEFYLDGKQIHRFGEVSKDINKIKAYDPLLKPVSLIVSEQIQHVMAVRYVLQPRLSYSTMYETRNPAIQIRLLTLKKAIDIFQFFTSTIVGMHLFTIGFCLLLAILHFAFYLFYPAQKANLSFATYALGFLLFNITQFYFFLIGHEVSSKFFIANFSMDLRITCNLFLLSALYNIFNQPKDKVYWVLIVLSIISIFLNVWPYDIGWKIGGASMEILVGAGVTRIAYIATRKGKRGAWIILGGAISYFVFFMAFFSYILIPNQSFLLNLSLLRIVLYILSFISIPLATSIFLGLDFAFANRSLNQKLHEIEELSEKNIQQEKEKQEILATQNETLEKQVAERTAELKASQAQLIQKEKLASLGELTAGIAHEIQNPLNFVNNFSELSVDLVKDLKDEIEKPAQDKEYIGELFDDLSQNQEKINHHGKRASSIVKGMLEHSRASTGVRELTDINKLADEYLRLSYHGLRAKDKDFNADYELIVDENLPKIEVIPQDMGRVLLNLINNAFYAVNQRKQDVIARNETISSYTPSVSVTTQQIDNQIIIKVKDNGTGMSEATKAKVFQPFFTTKPTGQGTGLGLSLAYDIVTKGHGGTLEVESTEGVGTEMIIHF